MVETIHSIHERNDLSHMVYFNKIVFTFFLLLLLCREEKKFKCFSNYWFVFLFGTGLNIYPTDFNKNVIRNVKRLFIVFSYFHHKFLHQLNIFQTIIKPAKTRILLIANLFSRLCDYSSKFKHYKKNSTPYRYLALKTNVMLIFITKKNKKKKKQQHTNRPS